ncbi:MAG: AAA family ATPase [Proteobacteria bacterium]|nr:AAA family ATPase [Pseudomonadota bacterium]
MQLTPEQKAIVELDSSCTVLGAPGTGKTRVLIEKAAHLIKNGVKPERILVASFTYRTMLLMRHELEKKLGGNMGGVRLATLRDLALDCMQKQDENFPDLIDNTTVRRYLRRAMREIDFPGSLQEAEHIMRQFKGRGRKPSEGEDHFELFRIYRDMLEKTGQIDRYDVVRKHIIGMRNDIYQPCEADWLLVDNIQDTTQIQLLWLIDHLKVGVKVLALGDDDQCMYPLDGALGGSAFTDLEELNDLPRYVLEKNFRSTAAIGQACAAVSRKITQRLSKKATAARGEGGDVRLLGMQTMEQELSQLAENVSQALKRNPKGRIGIIVRHDLQARRVERYLRAQNIPATNFARSVWETPGAILMLDLLEVLINRSTDDRLKNVFAGFGLSRQAIDALFYHGLVADTWLGRGAPLPKGLEAELPSTTMRAIGTLQRRLQGYYKMMGEVGPKDTFKAAAFDMIQNFRDDDRTDALHGLDELLSLKGRLTQMLDQIRDYETPDPTAMVLIAPVRESRNMEFDTVFMPMVTVKSYPMPMKVLDNPDRNERKLLFTGMSRAKNALIVSYSGEASPYLRDIEAVLPRHAA